MYNQQNVSYYTLCQRGSRSAGYYVGWNESNIVTLWYKYCQFLYKCGNSDAGWWNMLDTAFWADSADYSTQCAYNTNDMACSVDVCLDFYHTSPQDTLIFFIYDSDYDTTFDTNNQESNDTSLFAFNNIVIETLDDNNENTSIIDTITSGRIWKDDCDGSKWFGQCNMEHTTYNISNGEAAIGNLCFHGPFGLKSRVHWRKFNINGNFTTVSLSMNIYGFGGLDTQAFWTISCSDDFLKIDINDETYYDLAYRYSYGCRAANLETACEYYDDTILTTYLYGHGSLACLGWVNVSIDYTNQNSTELDLKIWTYTDESILTSEAWDFGDILIYAYGMLNFLTVSFTFLSVFFL